MSFMPHVCKWTLFLTIIVTAGSSLSQQQNRGVEDETGHVFAGFAELALNRDEVEKRFAMLIHFEYYSEITEGPPTTRNGYHIRLKDTKERLDYTGHCLIHPVGTGGLPFDSERWREILVCKGKVKGSMGPATYDLRLQENTQGEKEEDFSAKFYPPYFRPYDNIVLFASWYFFYAQNMKIDSENLFLSRATLVSSQLMAGGNVRSEWRWKFGDFDFTIEILQGAAVDYLPIEVRYRDSIKSDYYSHSRIAWKKQGDLWVPDLVNAFSVKKHGGEYKPFHWLMKFQWLLGNKVNDAFISCDLEDYRTPIMNEFGVEVKTKSGPGVAPMIPGDQWKRPEGLLFESPSLLDR